MIKICLVQTDKYQASLKVFTSLLPGVIFFFHGRALWANFIAGVNQYCTIYHGGMMLIYAS